MESEISVPIHVDVTCEQFIREIHPKRCPVILRGNDLGPCIRKWTPEYLSKAVGDKPVKIHVSESGQMNFLTKNFAYKTLAFDQVIKRAAEDHHDDYFISEKEVYYLRSLGNDPRGRDVADFALHFPELHQDLKLPDFLEPSTVFSSVFRVASAGVQLWTHYDVMDNLLIQVSGRKRAVLYSPEDLPNLYLDGDKSQVVDIDNPDELQYPLFSRATKYECLMEPGDILFIPALWFHNMTALDFSVAVNVFWRNLQPDFYDKKDPYGNKDPLPASKALQMVDSALKQLSVLPEEYQRFYKRRMLAKIAENLSESN